MFDSHARVVKRQHGVGGIIAVPQGMDGGANARREAENYMRQNCPGSYDIVEEGEVVVGQQGSQRTDSHKDRDIFNRKISSSQTQSQSVDITEWRMTYKCKK